MFIYINMGIEWKPIKDYEDYLLYKGKDQIKFHGSKYLLNAIEYSSCQLSYYLNTNKKLKNGPFKGYKVKRLWKKKLQRLSNKSTP